MFPWGWWQRRMSDFVQCVIYMASSISERSSKSIAAHGSFKHPGCKIGGLSQTADTVSKAHGSIRVDSLSSYLRFSRQRAQACEKPDKSTGSFLRPVDSSPSSRFKSQLTQCTRTSRWRYPILTWIPLTESMALYRAIYCVNESDNYSSDARAGQGPMAENRLLGDPWS